MNSKFKIIMIISGLGLLIIVLGSVLGGFIIKKLKEKPNDNQNINIEINTNQNVNINSHFPFSQDKFPVGDGTTGIEVTPKERKLFADYYSLEELNYTAQAVSYDLPLNIKTDVINYRDVARKINLDSVEEQLEDNGFAVITYPFTGEKKDFETAYLFLKNQVIPVVVTTDSIEHLNQLQLYTLFKEIEQEVFYQTIWQVSEKLYNRAKIRFDQRRQGLEIESDLLIEASRLETAFFATALELLKPKSNQIKDEGISIGLEKRFFSPQESKEYIFTLPDTLKDQVENEIQLINYHNKKQKSPLFLYSQDYSAFSPNPAYQSSEKLKNYSMAAKFYSEYLFPLYEKDQNCPDCLLDAEDQKITLLAASLIAQDFRDDKEARNLWLKIYKTLSFFQGLEYDFTYLHYLDALMELFGSDFNVKNVFSPTNPQVEENIDLLQQKLETYALLEIEGSQKETAEKGLKLLRAEFPTENYLLSKLTYPNVKEYFGSAEQLPQSEWPNTLCEVEQKYVRCLPDVLDILSLMDSKAAQQILDSHDNSNYQNYTQNVNTLKDEIQQFDKYTWLGNIYWSTLQNLQPTLAVFDSTYPTFMQSNAWLKKAANTVLASRFNLKKTYNIQFHERKEDKGSITTTVIDYGYVEPIPEYYNYVLALNVMLKNALVDLEIIAGSDPLIVRLDNNIDALTQLRNIATKELQNQPLTFTEIEFINDFYKQYQLIIGNLDLSTTNVNFDQRIYSYDRNRNAYESLENINIILVIYQTPAEETVLTAGPVFNYYQYKDKKILADWQKEFITQ